MKWTQFYFNECENKDYCFGVPGNICNHYCDINISKRSMRVSYIGLYTC